MKHFIDPRQRQPAVRRAAIAATLSLGSLLAGCVTLTRNDSAAAPQTAAAPSAGGTGAAGASATPAAGSGGGLLGNLLGALSAAAQGTGATGAGAAGGAAAPARAPGTIRNGIRGSELDDIFKKNPITSTQNPQSWPRVAITIKSATPGVFNFSGAGSLGPNDCVTFDARLWRSATEGRKFENLQLCVEAVEKEAKGVAFRTLNLLPRYTMPRNINSTAAQRTEGPNPPFYVFPQDMRSMQAWPMAQTNAIFFLGSIFLSLGWDWDNDFDRRLWVVSVPLPAAGY
ncbi:MAG: hypothetical protein ACK57B_11600 [Betaproteobacteria bacterium]|jgi:hypothetical protein